MSCVCWVGEDASIGLAKNGYKIKIFLISSQKHMVGCSLEMPHQGASNEYPQHMFSWRNKKKYEYFWIEIAHSIVSVNKIFITEKDNICNYLQPLYLCIYLLIY